MGKVCLFVGASGLHTILSFTPTQICCGTFWVLCPSLPLGLQDGLKTLVINNNGRGDRGKEHQRRRSGEVSIGKKVCFLDRELPHIAPHSQNFFQFLCMTNQVLFLTPSSLASPLLGVGRNYESNLSWPKIKKTMIRQCSKHNISVRNKANEVSWLKCPTWNKIVHSIYSSYYDWEFPGQIRHTEGVMCGLKCTTKLIVSQDYPIKLRFSYSA